MEALTLVVDEEAHAGAAAVGGEEQVQEAPRADEELGRLGAVVLANQRGGAGGPVPHFQGVVVDFRLESVDMRHVRTDGSPLPTDVRPHRLVH